MKLQKETIPPERAAKRIHGRWYDDACGTAFGLELLGERWSLLIVRELLFGPRRFSDVRVSLPGLSAKVLTERLATLEEHGVLRRRTEREPAPAKLFELTDWGRRAEIVIQELGRWAAMSPEHDPTLPLSPSAMMASLRTMLDREKADGLDLTVDFSVGSDAFTARLSDGAMAITRGSTERPDIRFVAPDGSALAALVYGKVPPSEVGAEIVGDRSLSGRFLALFALPEKSPIDPK